MSETGNGNSPRHRNRLLVALPDNAYQQIEGHLEQISLKNGLVLHCYAVLREEYERLLGNPAS